MSPLVEIGLTDLPKSGCAMAHPGTTGLSEVLEGLRSQENLISQNAKMKSFAIN